MAEPMSEKRLDCLAGLAALPCSCGVADCENYMSALTREQAQDLADEAKRARAELAAATARAETAEAAYHRLDSAQAGHGSYAGRAEAAEAKRDQLRARLAGLKAAGMQYRANGPLVHGVSEGNVRDCFADQWVEGYWPEGRQLYAGLWQRIDKVCDDDAPHADLERADGEQGDEEGGAS